MESTQHLRKVYVDPKGVQRIGYLQDLDAFLLYQLVIMFWLSILSL